MRDGFQHVEAVLSRDEIDKFIDQLEPLAEVRGGARQAELPASLATSLAGQSRLSKIAGDLLGVQACLVRVLLFDKTPSANWGVPWHQDRTIAVRNRGDVPGYSCWTRRQGYWQVEPPVGVLENMITLRVHLDDCGLESGPLAVIPGSHSNGRLTQAEIGTMVDRAHERVCLERVGDVLAMRPLLVHSSRHAVSATHRRVMHLEYASCHLALPVDWALGEAAYAERGQRAPNSIVTRP